MNMYKLYLKKNMIEKIFAYFGFISYHFFLGMYRVYLLGVWVGVVSVYADAAGPNHKSVRAVLQKTGRWSTLLVSCCWFAVARINIFVVRRSSFDWNDAPYDIPDMFSKPGTPCSDYNGYCDVFQKCREVDPSGPLATLRKLLLSEESIASFKKWVSNHWYAVLVIVCTVLILLVRKCWVLIAIVWWIRWLSMFFREYVIGAGRKFLVWVSAQ